MVNEYRLTEVHLHLILKKNKVKKGVYFLAFFALAKVGAAQPAPSEVKQAEYFFENKKYGAAGSFYGQLLQKDPYNADLNYKMGVCYMNSRSQKEKAVPYLLRAAGEQEKNQAPRTLTYKMLADANFIAGNFENAIANYSRYKELLMKEPDTDTSIIKETDMQIEICKLNAELKLVKNVMAAAIDTKSRAGDGSSQVNYNTTYSADSSMVILTFKRSELAGELAPGIDYFENSAPLTFPEMAKVSSDTSRALKEATVTTSVDGQILLTYRDEQGDGNIYLAVLNGNEWTVPEKLDEQINTSGWEADEFISADGRTMYFTSAGPGGYGGKDIYKSTKLVNGKWSKAINLGYPVNTPFNEEAPFVHPDGATLFFGSDRYRTDGSFDVFSATHSDSGWSQPLNVGYPVMRKEIRELPVNTKKGETSLPEKENCLVTFLSPKKTTLTLIRGKVTDAGGNALSSLAITVSDNVSGEVVGRYFTDTKTGSYAFILPPGKNNHISFEAEGYLFHSENMDLSAGSDVYRINHAIVLEPLTENSKTVLRNIFFTGEAELAATSETELQKMTEFLKSNPGIQVEISSLVSIDKKEKESKELVLLEKRVNAVAKDLVAHGVKKESIETRVYQKIKRSGKRKKRKPVEIFEEGIIELKITKIK